MQSKRQRQISCLLKTEIADIICTRMNDPSMGFITVTDVLLSNDIRTAKVFFSVLGDENQKLQSLKNLQKARVYIQNELRSRVRLRYLPVLKFFLDQSWNSHERIDNILQNLELDGKSTEK
jgi:ribosome-binding factor A